MDLPTHQDDFEQLDAATKKRPLPVDGTGEYGSLGIDGYYPSPSKRPCTTSDPSSQQLQYEKYESFIARPPVDHRSLHTESVAQPTSSTLWEGHNGWEAWDVSEQSQILRTGYQTTLDIGKTNQFRLQRTGKYFDSFFVQLLAKLH